jgi:hypothetical protein
MNNFVAQGVWYGEGFKAPASSTPAKPPPATTNVSVDFKSLLDAIRICNARYFRDEASRTGLDWIRNSEHTVRAKKNLGTKLNANVSVRPIGPPITQLKTWILKCRLSG